MQKILADNELVANSYNEHSFTSSRRFTMNQTYEARPPFPPFILDTAMQKVGMAED